eukprot:TRINITY_DN812_c0_g1_i1.p1 TRINITY_DN812_c0_g1~~TRINITY_DN812_c0_g1_i1.p1  ORF type:complete len:161 (+),score=2.43 TRINITY_DN812_c0_g1_i1:23-484(+)
MRLMNYLLKQQIFRKLFSNNSIQTLLRLIPIWDQSIINWDNIRRQQRTILKYSNLGSIYNQLGQYKEAIENHTKAIHIMKSAYEGVHPNLAAVYSNLGSIYNQLGQYKEAIENHTKAIHIMERAYKGIHPNLAAVKIQRSNRQKQQSNTYLVK